MMGKVLFFVLVSLTITQSSTAAPDDCFEFDLEQLEDYTSSLNFTEDYENSQDNVCDAEIINLPFGDLKSDWERIILLHSALTNDSALQGKLKKFIKILAVAHSEIVNATKTTFFDYNDENYSVNREFFNETEEKIPKKISSAVFFIDNNNTEINVNNETTKIDVDRIFNDPGNDFISKRLNFTGEMTINEFEESSSDKFISKIMEGNDYSNYSEIYQEETTLNTNVIIDENIELTKTSNMDEFNTENCLDKIGTELSISEEIIPEVYHKKNTSFITNDDNQNSEKMKSEAKPSESSPKIATENDAVTNQWSENVFVPILNKENEESGINSGMGELHEELITAENNNNNNTTFNANFFRQSSSTSTPQGTFDISSLSPETNQENKVENSMGQKIQKTTIQFPINGNSSTIPKNNFIELLYKYLKNENPKSLGNVYSNIRNILKGFNASTNFSDSSRNVKEIKNIDEISKIKPNTPTVFPYVYFPRFSTEKSNKVQQPWEQGNIKSTSMNTFDWPYLQERIKNQQRLNDQQKPVISCRTCIICTEE